MANHRTQAERNEQLSLDLYKEGVFLDWSVTTAFYSALHFVHGKIIPGKYNNRECSSISDGMVALGSSNKHDATCDMLSVTLPLIRDDYKFLMDSSFTARYLDYDVSQPFAKICQKKLKKIKEHCTP